MKKITIILSIFTICLFFNIKKVNASSHIENKVLIEEEQMNKNVLYQYYNMDTSYNLNDTKKTRDVYTYTIKQSNDSFLATWTMSDRDNYKLSTLDQIAKDYEKKHPGYIVLGGVNAEGYYNGEPTNAIVQDGDVIRKDVSYESFKELIGFKKDHSVVIKQAPTTSDYLRLKTNNQKFDITKTNELPFSNGVSILTPDLKTSLDLTGYDVFECSYTLFRKSEEFPDPRGTINGPNLGLFVKGKIISKSIINQIEKVPYGKFYIVTNNASVSSNMIIENDIKCEFEYTDEFSDVVSMTGYMYKYLEDGVTIPASYVDTNDIGNEVVYNCAYYLSTSKERCGIGFKEDGSIVLLTTNTGKVGPTQYEVGEMFKDLGCKDAYQFDGGGSVTFLKRDDYGNIKMMNTPGDGSARSIMTGLFIVARDPGFISNQINSTASTVTLTKKTTTFAKEITDIRAVVGNKEIEITEDKAVIEGLEDNKEHAIEIRYKYKGEECSAIVYAKTKAYSPGLDINANHDGFTITKRTTDEVLKTVDATFMVDGVPYKMGNVEEFKIEGLFKDTTYSISYTYTVLNTKTNETFERTKEASTYKTLSYEIPSVEKFELASSSEASGRVAFNYKYSDPDNLVTKAYILINNEEEQQLTSKSGYASITSLELGKIDYEFKIVLEYEVLDRLSYAYSEIINIAKKEHIHTWDEATCEAPKTCTDCGETEGTSLGHEWTDATCENPTTCTRCNKTEGSKLQHSWTDATSDAPKTCTKCGETEGEPLPKKKGCKKSSLASIILSIGLVTSALYLIRRKK